jgi:hypothetical protein
METTLTSETFSVRSEDPNSSDAQSLLDEMAAMDSVFGLVGGRRPFASFSLPGRSVLLLVRDSAGVPFGCGAVVPASHYVGGVTGPYCRPHREEVNEAVLRRLEKVAAQFGFVALNIEVSEQNHRMLAFFQARGFLPTTTCVDHRTRVGLRCLQKRLSQDAGCFRSLLP